MASLETRFSSLGREYGTSKRSSLPLVISTALFFHIFSDIKLTFAQCDKSDRSRDYVQFGEVITNENRKHIMNSECEKTFVEDV